MGMNLDCILYLQANGWLTPDKNRILDVGPQNVYFCTEEQISKFIANHRGEISDDKLTTEIKRLAYFSTPRPEERTTLFSEIADLAGIEYQAIDICPAPKTILLDLNYDQAPSEYHDHFDVVLNFGTTEHIFNQWNCFEIIHDSVKTGGIIYCILPLNGYLTHGYYCYTPLFFRDLARANDYELIELFLVPAGQDSLSGHDVRSEGNFYNTSSGQSDSNSQSIFQFNVHALMRKTVPSPFRCTMEVATAHSAPAREITKRYETAASSDRGFGQFKDELAIVVQERDEARTQRDEARTQALRFEQEKNDRITERDSARTEADYLRQIVGSRSVRLARCLLRPIIYAKAFFKS